MADRRPQMARCSGEKLTTIEISHDEGIDPLLKTDCEALKRIATDISQSYTMPTAVRLIFVADDYMAHLNSAYRDKKGTTDVLSFDLGSTPGQPHSGEVYISLPQARHQAVEQGVPELEELARLFVHGLLHLAGWVHDTPEQLTAMERETEIFLDAIPC